MEYISDQTKYFPLLSKFPLFKRSNCYFMYYNTMFLHINIDMEQ